MIHETVMYEERSSLILIIIKYNILFNNIILLFYISISIIYLINKNNVQIL